MALGYKFYSQCSHENFKHGRRSQEIASVPCIFPSLSLFLSGAAHLGCYESYRCERDDVPTPPSPSLSSSLSLCWTVILVYFRLNYNCKNCYGAVYLLCVISHCLYLLLFALPLLSLCLTLAAAALLQASRSLCSSLESAMLCAPVRAGKNELTVKIQD